ncbi:flagellar basal body-associated protein FliL [Ureibacillus thermophilus]|uniref:Flagellar protein FliL n=1 Tax=Ureibacillus thermophilus TaxID=367743 RepID=A0A4P6UU13_9BACL|nr:flagellar basal body-associated protein FliL [Ureibacillus thermophilus]QBK25641.1 flagellar basal body-associated protein FliL [Ureibacillus thermophilus]
MKNNKLLTVMLIILVSITLIGVVLFVVITQMNKQSSTLEPSIDDILESSVDIPELTTNLADGQFIRIELKIQTDSKKAAEELTKRDFQTKNIIIEELAEMTEENLKGKEGIILLENTIKARLNELMQEGEVQQVYITSYIIQ